MPRQSGLGKGLDALIPGGDTQPVDGGVTQLPIESIVRNPRQPRTSINADELQELANSIREHGILQPLIVSREADGSHYVLIAGERRLEAARLANLKFIPVILRQVTDQDRLELALIENIQRADLMPLETAEAYRQLSEEFHLSHEEIASRVGKSRVAVTNTLRLLNLPGSIQKALVDGEITEGHARALLGLTNPRAMEAALRTVLFQKMTVRQTEELVNKLKGEKPPTSIKEGLSPEEKSLEDFIRASLGQKISVKIGKDRNSGSMTLYYGSEEEFQDLMIRLTGQKYNP